MFTTFISYSREDRSFARLLARILQYHFIDCWFDEHSIQAGEKYPPEIDDAIDNSEIFLIICSKNTISSKWVTREITRFIARNPKKRIIPIKLYQINLDDIFHGLNDRQYIDFSNDYVEGFERLLVIYDKEFLCISNRRSQEDRRKQISDERRKTSTLQRMRFGFWKTYFKLTKKDKRDYLTMSVADKIQVTDILKKESERYTFFTKDTGKPIHISDALVITIDKVWEYFRNHPDMTHAINIIEMIAEQLDIYFDVKQVDRRKNERRKKDSC